MSRNRRAGVHIDTPTMPVRSRRFVRPDAVVGTYALLAALAATGGARPTAIGAIDAVLLAAGAVGIAACARRARTIPVYVAAGAAAASQTEVVPVVVGLLALVAAFSLQARWVRRYSSRRVTASALAGGLAWCAMVGAPLHGAGPWWPVPLAAMAWLVVSARVHGSESFQRRWNRIVTTIVGVTALCAGLGAFALLSARADVVRGANRLDAGLAAARSGDTDLATRELDGGARALSSGEDALGAVWARPALLVPGVSQNLHSLHTTVRAASDVADVATATAADVDLERLGATAGRLDPAAIAAVEEPLNRVITALEMARGDVGSLEDLWLVPMVRDEIDKVSGQLADASASAQLARDGVAVVPGLIGADGPRTYLVLFTTPVEARATTGFPGNYAEIRFDGGRFEMTEFGRVHDLNRNLPGDGITLSAPDDYLTRYQRFGVHRDWRNITMSPDFPTVAGVAAQLYPQSGGVQIDGVLSVDPWALAALMDFTGPIRVPGAGVTLSRDNAVEYLLRDQYIEFETDNPERIDVLEIVAEDAFQTLESGELPGPKGLRRVLGPATEQGHLQFHAFDPDAAGFLETLGVTGRMPSVTDDFVSVTTTNSAGNKIDLFMERDLAYEVTWDPDSGEIEATATITLTNTAPPAGLPHYLIGNSLGRRPNDPVLPEGSNYSFVTLYSPWIAKGATLDGAPVGLEWLPELDRNAYSAFIGLAPGQSRTLVVDLLGSISDREYVLDVGVQPSVTPDAFTLALSVAGPDLPDVTGELNSVTTTADDTREFLGTADLEANLQVRAEVAE